MARTGTGCTSAAGLVTSSKLPAWLLAATATASGLSAGWVSKGEIRKLNLSVLESYIQYSPDLVNVNIVKIRNTVLHEYFEDNLPDI